MEFPLLDDLIDGTLERGEDLWRPDAQGDARRMSPESSSIWEYSSMTLDEYNRAKKGIADLIIDRLTQRPKNNNTITIKRTEDIRYGFKVYFRTFGNDTEITLFLRRLIDDIKKFHGLDVSTVELSRVVDHTLNITFHKPFKVACCRCFLQILFWCVILFLLMQAYLLFSGSHSISFDKIIGDTKE